MATQDLRTIRISVDSAEREANNESFDEAVSADGRYVAFSSEASNLVKGDTNDAFDVFMRDQRRGVTVRVSLRSHGRQANGHSSDPSISADGRYVAFTSAATNLVSGDTNKAVDVFVYDRKRKVTSRVSVGPHGRQSTPIASQPITYADTAISANGRYVAFTSTASDLVARDTNRAADVFVRDRRSGVTSRVSVSSAERQGNQQSLSPGISADGRYVSFTSDASTLVAGDRNATADVFVRDRRKGTTSRISVSAAGRQGNGDSQSPAISGNGRYIVFTSTADNLVAGDTNGGTDVFVYDRRRKATSRVSVRPGGGQARPGSPATVFPDTAVSANGRYVVFTSTADNVVRGDSNRVADVFVRDREAKTTRRVSVGPAGRQANDMSLFPAISADGRHVVFASEASDLVPGDANDTADVFVHGPR